MPNPKKNGKTSFPSSRRDSKGSVCDTYIANYFVSGGEKVPKLMKGFVPKYFPLLWPGAPRTFAEKQSEDRPAFFRGTEKNEGAPLIIPFGQFEVY